MLIKLRNKLTKYNSHKVINLLKNSGWIFFDKIFRIATGLFVSVWIARYLGPDKFGILNYVATFPMFFTALAGLGLTNVLYNDFIIQKDTHQLKKLFCSSVIIKLISGVFCLTIAVISSVIIDRDNLIILLIGISSIYLITQSFDVVDTYFQSQRKVQYSILPKLIVFGLCCILRVIALWSGKDIMYFVLINCIEQIFSALISLFVYAQYVQLKLPDVHIYFPIVNDLVKRSWPLMVSEFFYRFMYELI
ncbi:oligosaccharide flippase family protein [Spirosoma sp. KNUC1025]|uniref:oligosaccharide flippase family protein n=1 Tax=Spirosoma sp. KNUC1025 TaxID=2894082 RepID=UPI00386DD642